MKTFKIYTLGCKVNLYDSGELANCLAGFGLVKTKNSADVVIVNTCAVTKVAVRKNRQIIVKARTENPEAKIAVIGCWPKAYGEATEDLGVDLVLSGRETLMNAKAIAKLIGEISAQSGCADLLKPTDRARYFLKIQDGCRQFCSYCIIPYTRGDLKSRVRAEVLAEAEEAARAGYEEIILSGIHLGLYGVDLAEEKINLVGLLKDLVKIEGIKKIRLSSIEITEVSAELIDFISQEAKICRHLHIPLQAGCDKILKLMNRPYTTEYFSEKIKALREKMPQISITTDVIVGFPGETETDFATTEKFIKEIGFSRLHVFSFSAHERTPSFNLPDRVNVKDIKERSEVLRVLSIELEEEYVKQFAGKKITATIINKKEAGYTAKTEYYFEKLVTDEDIATRPEPCHNLIGRVVEINL
jgi:threonylcarbamoyladenosine tRNA methylthiotransferase MtaB